MEVYCIQCHRRVSRQTLVNHQRGPKCQADTTARMLLVESGLLPYPRGHDLPEGYFPLMHAMTRARYEAPWIDDSGAVVPYGRSGPSMQVWAPAWVRAMTDAWADLGRARKNRRDELLRALSRLGQDRLRLLVPTPRAKALGLIELAERMARE